MTNNQRKRTIISLPILSLILVLLFIFLRTPVQSTADQFTQPIIFSHKSHAGTNEIPCEFCHTYARRSISSGAPSLESCIGCHKVIKGSDDKQKKDIQKLDDYWKAGKTIPWKKIHDLPDFVHFSHKRHIQIGYDCTQCHGNIFEQEEITMTSMVTDLSMGWCMECHKLTQPTAAGKIPGPTRMTRGGQMITNKVTPAADGTLWVSKDCYVCHK